MAPNDAKVWDTDVELTNEKVSEHLGRVVEGESVGIGEVGSELGNACDVERVRKVYKLNDGKKGTKGAVVNGDGGKGKEDERKEIESVILGIMALKGA